MLESKSGPASGRRATPGGPGLGLLGAEPPRLTAWLSVDNICSAHTIARGETMRQPTRGQRGLVLVGGGRVLVGVGFGGGGEGRASGRGYN